MIEWFVIYNNEHLGPFSENVLHQLYKEGDVKEDTLVWREGMDEAITYESQFIFTAEQQSFKPLTESTEHVKEVSWEVDEDAPPPLPTPSTGDVLPDAVEQVVKAKAFEAGSETAKEEAKRHDSIVDQVKAVKKSLETSSENKIEEKKKEVVEQEEGEEEENPIDYLNHLVDDEITREVHRIKKSSKRNKYFLLAGALVFLVVLVPATLFVKNIYVSFSRPEQMSILDYGRLKDISRDPSFENKFGIAVSQDRSKIWLVTNNPYEGNIVLKIKSIKDRTLTNKQVEATAKGKLRGKIAVFENWTFTKGVKMEDGYYNVEAYTTKDLDMPVVLQLYAKRKTQFRFFDEVLISQLTEEEFAQELNKTKKVQVKNDLAFWEELKQKYQTIKMITVQIKNEIDRAFTSDNINWKEELRKFETRYKREFGTFFTNFVIQNDQSYNELKQKNFTNKLEIISNYNRLSGLAKEVGKATMDIFHEMETFDGIDYARKEILWKRARLRLSNIIKTCDDKVKIIQVNQ